MLGSVLGSWCMGSAAARLARPPREQTAPPGEAARPQKSDGGRDLRPRRSICAVGAARNGGAAGVSAITVCSVLPLGEGAAREP